MIIYPPLIAPTPQRYFAEQGFTAAILVISMQVDPAQIQSSFLSGANGFINKAEIDEHLVEAVRSVHQGERYLSPKAREAYNSIEQ